MKKAKPLIGVVTLTDGTPVPKAEVVLLDSASSIYMDEDGKISTSPVTTKLFPRTRRAASN